MFLDHAGVGILVINGASAAIERAIVAGFLCLHSDDSHEGAYGWGAWPMSTPGFFIGADCDGPGGGCPMTKIAPGQGYPEGWQHVSVPWE